MDLEKIPYNLIDSGQHGRLVRQLRKDLALREPDVSLGQGENVTSPSGAIAWLAQIMFEGLLHGEELNKRVFQGQGGVCLVHGDTPTTLISGWLAKRAKIKLAHVESGLRSHNYLNPFPEELIRVLVMKKADILFPPSEWAERNLRKMGARGRVCRLPGNTNIEALLYSLDRHSSHSMNLRDYCVVTIHRFETLYSPRRLRKSVQLIERLSRDFTVIFVIHPPTEKRLRQKGLLERLIGNPRIMCRPLLPHDQFVTLLKGATLVVTDGGSIQEETHYLGVPCLVMRKKTERMEGLGSNACLAKFDQEIIEKFLLQLPGHSFPLASLDLCPSSMIVDELRPYQ